MARNRRRSTRTAGSTGSRRIRRMGRGFVYTRNVAGEYSLWTVASGGGEATLLTGGPGRAGSPSWSAEGRSVVYTHESPLAPPEVWEVEVATGRTTRRTFAAMAGIAASDLVLPEHVSWTSRDGFEVHGLLYAPQEVRPGRHGCLVEIHGGPMNQSRAVWNRGAPVLRAAGLGRRAAKLSRDARVWSRLSGGVVWVVGQGRS